MTVTALLISHDGARWLPAVLDGLAGQSRRPDRLLAVDTGSADGARAILAERLGPDRVLDARADAPFAAAVGAGLEHLSSSLPHEHDGPADGDTDDTDDWVWLLHDDSRPAPDALEQLLEVARSHPDAAVLGPKLREWPSLRRLLEVGVTMTGTATRETGLERGEYDQGQHDTVHEVLAVNTAGMLVRRRVLEQLGFDPALPVFGADLDFGWRAARSGHRTLVVPDAVVFHVEAARRALRPTAVVRSARRAERAAALHTNLVNCATAVLPFQLVRLLLGSVLRALGLLLVRAPREALDELAAAGAVYGRPQRLVAGRRWRRRESGAERRSVRPLLAPPWLPYRHGVDLVGELVLALVRQLGEAQRPITEGRRRRRRARTAETGPVPEEAETLPDDGGLLTRLLTSPVFGGAVVLLVLSAVAARGLLGPGYLAGGALLPAPDSALTWWQVYLERWHAEGVGSDAPAGAYLVPMAVAATVLFGKAWLVVDLLLLLAVPLAAWSAHGFLRRLVRGRWVPLWGAPAYGLLPVLTGAVGQGRLGTVAGLVLLPLVAASALRLVPSTPPDRRRRAGWRLALLLTLLTAFTPVAWVMAVALAVLAVGWRLLAGDASWRTRGGWGPVLAGVLPVPLLLLPSTLPAVLGAEVGPWWSEAGRAATELLEPVGPLDLLLARPTDAGSAPGWLSAGLLVAALAALLRRDTRSRVTAAWVVLLVATTTAALLAQVPAWAGFPLAVAHGAAVAAVALAGAGISTVLAGRSFGWRQPIGVVAGVAALLTPLLGTVWWVSAGVASPLERRPAVHVPTYMAEAARGSASDGTLVVRAVTAPDQRVLEYLLVRGDGRRLGDETLTPAAEGEASLGRIVKDLATAPQPEDIDALARHGVAFVYGPPPADDELSGNLDSVSGLTSASAPRPGARAWQLETTPSTTGLPAPTPNARAWLLVLQGLALLVAVVLALPSRETSR